MFRILWDPSSGSIGRAALKLLATFCVRSRWLAAWFLESNVKFWNCTVQIWHSVLYYSQNFRLPNTDYAHKTS